MAGSQVDMLRRSAVFLGLSDPQLERVAGLGEEETFAEGAVIVQEDEPGKSCYLLMAGRVEVWVRSPFERQGEQKLATIKSGELFGELSLVDGFLRSATARALDEVEVLRFDNEGLESLMEEDPRVGYLVMRNIANQLGRKMRDTNMRLRNALSDVFYC